MCKTDKTIKPILSASSSGGAASASASTAANSAGTNHADIQLVSLRKALPEDVFVKSLLTSCYYLLFDVAMWLGSLSIALLLTSSDYWKTLGFWQQAVFSFLYWNFAGFFMWCLFVVGHDCGHGTFSEYEWVNDLIGNLTHGSLLVPYWPWQLTHRRHHMYHNHVEKDYSHPWFTPERMEREESWVTRLVHQYNFVMASFPYIGWPLYLLGAPDGNHFIPFPSDRMWKETPVAEYYKCIASTVMVLCWGTGVMYLCNWNLMSFLYYYFAPLLVFGWWLVTVTYLQHHSPDTLVHDDTTWKFVQAAFETVDREYGSVIDSLSHHITDCHVIHHLFFTKIPHYNLARATEAMKTYLKENNAMEVYKFEKTHDFFYRVHYYLISNGLRAVLFRPTPSTSSSPQTVANSPSSSNLEINHMENKKVK